VIPEVSYTECVLRRAVLALSALALVVGLVACGGVAQALDPVAAAAGKSADAGSVRVSIDASFSAGGVGGSITADGVFDQDEGELTLDATDLLKSLGAPGGEVKVITTKQDSHTVVYVNLGTLASMVPGGKAWLKADVDEAASLAGGNYGQLLGLSGQSPAQTLDLLTGAGTVVEVGTETLDGAAVTHYRATVDLIKALEQRGVPPEAVAALKASGVSTELPIDVWIGVDDGYVHRVHFAYDTTAQGQAVSAELTMTMSDWGTDVSIDVPPDDQVFDVTAFAAQLRKS
jgi:hypothetical protein